MPPASEQILNALMDAINKVNEIALYCQSCPHDKDRFIYAAESCLDNLPGTLDIFIDAVNKRINDVRFDINDFTIQGAVEMSNGRIVAVKDVIGYAYEVELAVGDKPIAVVIIEEKVQCEGNTLVARAEAYIGDIYDDTLRQAYCAKVTDDALCV